MSAANPFRFRFPAVFILVASGSLALAQDPAPKVKAPASPESRPARGASDARTITQAEAASKTAKFGKIAKTDESYKTALDAHALADAQKMVDKAAAFKGTVTKVFEPRSGIVAILNFDENYRTALSAALQKENYDKLPALTNLVGKDILVSGKFIQFQERVEVVLTNAAQIKIVE